jgi:hypothetical protein
MLDWVTVGGPCRGVLTRRAWESLGPHMRGVGDRAGEVDLVGDAQFGQQDLVEAVPYPAVFSSQRHGR